MIDVVLLGSTGSIGTQALEVIASNPGRFRVVGLAGGRNAETLGAQARAHGVGRVAMGDRDAAAKLRVDMPDLEVLDGPEGVTELAAVPADVVLNGVTGSGGLASTLSALRAGTRVALANKESLIVGGELVIEAATRAAQRSDELSTGIAGPLGGLRCPWLLPVDSEHSALAQCLRGAEGAEIDRLLVTASGGPFRGRTRTDLAFVTLEEALAHPTWSMGSVITVNSATLANKGLEVIEAHLLFGVGYERIEVVVHPQSVVHGMVEFCDGTTIAKLSPPDMRLPIQLALGAPTRVPTAPARFDWTRSHELAFEPVDSVTFPMLDLATAAGRAGGTAPAVFNAANEEAVEAFLRKGTSFLGITDTVAATLEEHESYAATDLETVLAAERWARAKAREHLLRGD